jgi:hypothetical protein
VIAQRDLSVGGHHHLAIATDADHRRRAYQIAQFISRPVSFSGILFPFGTGI